MLKSNFRRRRLALWFPWMLLGVSACNVLSATRFADSPTALAIEGRGWFLVSEPGTDQEFFTRHGNFLLNESGKFVTEDGFVLQGMNSIDPESIADIVVDSSGMPSGSDPLARIESFRIERDGSVVVRLTDETEFVRARVLLQDFRMPANLVRVQPHLYAGVPQAEAIGGPQSPGANGIGWLRTNRLEREEVRWSSRGTARKGSPLLRGALTATGISTDLGIRGDGFFLVRDPRTSELLATRAGLFVRDSGGHLVTYTGLRVQGWADAWLTVPGDVRIDVKEVPVESAPTAVEEAFWIERDGSVLVRLTDGTVSRSGKIVLHRFENPERLKSVGDGIYAGVSEAIAIPLASGSPLVCGTIHQGAVELVQVTRGLIALRREFEFFEQGPFRRTESPSDLAIGGRGFFLTHNSVDGSLSVTRRGRFHFDEDGYLVTAQGRRIQGFVDPASLEVGDIQLDGQERPSYYDQDATITGFNIDHDGELIVHLSDGTVYGRAQILLQDFSQPHLLKSAGDGCFTNLVAAGMANTMVASGEQGMGRIFPNALEIPVRPQRLMLPSVSGVQLLITGEPGSRCAVETRVVNRRWVTLGTIVLGSTGEADFFDASQRKRSYPAYRVVAE